MASFAVSWAKRNIKRGSFIGRHFSPGVTLSLTNVLLLAFLFAKETPKVAYLSRTILPEGHVRKTPRSQRFDAPIVRDKWTSFGVSFSKRNTKSSTFCLRQCDARGEMSPDKWPTFDVPFCPRNSKRGPFVGRHFASPDSLWGDVWGAERGAQRPHRSPEAGSATSPSLA